MADFAKITHIKIYSLINASYSIRWTYKDTGSPTEPLGGDRMGIFRIDGMGVHSGMTHDERMLECRESGVFGD